MPPDKRIDQDTAFWIRGRVAEWLTVKFKHEQRGVNVYLLRKLIEGKDDNEVIPWREFAGQLIPDAWHSALLMRLLSGREALPEPPPTQHSYPVYPDFATWEITDGS